MVVMTSKVLTVSYGTFSCTLEGFDEPFAMMKVIAEYFRDLAAEDRYFGAIPPQPDSAVLQRLAVENSPRGIDARVDRQTDGTSLTLRAQPTALDDAATAVIAPLPAMDTTDHPTKADAPPPHHTDNIGAPPPADPSVLSASTANSPLMNGSMAHRLTEARNAVDIQPSATASPATRSPDQDIDPADIGFAQDGAVVDDDFAVTPEICLTLDSCEPPAPAPETPALEAETFETLAIETAPFETAAPETAGMVHEADVSPAPIPTADLAPPPADRLFGAAGAEPRQNEHPDFIDVMDSKAQTADDDVAPPNQSSLSASEQTEDNLRRLFDTTEEQLNGVDNQRRISTIAQLRAVVAATIGDHLFPGRRLSAEPEGAISPKVADAPMGVPLSDEAPSDAITLTPANAPLILVAAQRIDAPAPDTVQHANDMPEPPAPLPLKSATQSHPLPGEFARFLRSYGSDGLDDILEAAAAYTALIEGRDHFSPPELMSKLASISEDSDFTPEERLRVFGRLLRQGKIAKIKPGQYTITEASRYYQKRA